MHKESPWRPLQVVTKWAAAAYIFRAYTGYLDAAWATSAGTAALIPTDPVAAALMPVVATLQAVIRLANALSGVAVTVLLLALPVAGLISFLRWDAQRRWY